MVVVNRTLDNAVHALVDDYRTQCLWFLRPDYYPATQEERLRVLDSSLSPGRSTQSRC